MWRKEKIRSNINRAIGILQGLSYGVSLSAQAGIEQAINIIEESLAEIFNEEADHG